MIGVLGVLGGMGPLATADFLTKLTEATPAKRDCDHIPYIANSLPQIPDRTRAIMGEGPSPLPDFIKMAQMLKAAGVDFAIMACNTAHHWYDDLVASTDLEFLHIVDAVSADLQRRSLRSKKVGLMATPGTIKSGFYKTRLAQSGYDCHVSDETGIQRIHEGIKDVKANNLDAGFEKFMIEVEAFKRSDITTIILGCTELPLVLNDPEIFIDSSQALAQACVARAFEKQTPQSIATA